MARRSVLDGFGQRLRTLRRAAELTQSDLAERASLAVETISRLETGKWPNTTIEVVERLAAALGVGITALFEPLPSALTKPGARASVKRVVAVIENLDDNDLDDVARALRLLVGVRQRRRKRAARKSSERT